MAAGMVRREQEFSMCRMVVYPDENNFVVDQAVNCHNCRFLSPATDINV